MRNKLLAFCFLLLPVTAALSQANNQQAQENVVRLRKELASLGVKWNYEEFVRYLYANDTLVISLFAQGGLKLDAEEFVPYVLEHYSNTSANLLIKYNALSKNCCILTPGVHFNDLFENLISHPARQSLMKNICSAADVMQIDDYIKNEKAKIEKFEKLKSPPAEASCTASFGNDIKMPLAKLFDKYYDEASHFDPLGPTTYTTKELVLARLNTALLLKNPDAFADPINYFKTAVREACPEFYIILETDPYYLDLLKNAKLIVGKYVRK